MLQICGKKQTNKKIGLISESQKAEIKKNTGNL